jgi:hypothetical protein
MMWQAIQNNLATILDWIQELSKEEVIGLLALLVAIVGLFISHRKVVIKIKQWSPGAAKTIPTLDSHDLTRLPQTLGKFAEREECQAKLSDAWTNPGTNIFVLTALSGAGKTALVHKWLSGFLQDNTPDMTYLWSFADQGAGSLYEPSAEAFFADALQHYGYSGKVLHSDHEKGIALANLMQAKPQLVILDGLEVMQQPEAQGGKLRHAGLQALLRQLALHNPGMILITSRQPVVEIQDDPTVVTEPLPQLEVEEAWSLFKGAGLRGTQAEHDQMYAEWQGHALSLNLLATYLQEHADGDIRCRHELTALWDFPSDEPQAERAFLVLQAYEQKLADDEALTLLYLLGLFDQPIGVDEIEQLSQAKIRKLRPIQELTAKQLRQAVRWLRRQGLLNSNTQRPDPLQDPHQIGYPLDTHPLIRKYFAYRFRTAYARDWRAAHRVLYDYYCALPEQEQPDTVDEMQPLFAAVRHGCLGGWHEEAFQAVYYPRISRQNEGYLRNKLGQVSLALSVLARFFESPWDTPAAGLTSAATGFFLNDAAINLHASSRLPEAVVSYQAGLAIRMAQQDWHNASASARNISQLHLTLGNVAAARESAQQVVELAKPPEDSAQLDVAAKARYADECDRMASHALLARVLSVQGDYAAAHAEFKLAEQLQQAYQPDVRWLYSGPGYWYIECWLAQGDWVQAQQRADDALQIVQCNHYLLGIGLHQISLGRACLQQALTPVLPDRSWHHPGEVPLAPDAQIWRSAQQAELNLSSAQQEQGTTALVQAQDWLDQAVATLRESSREDQIPRSLLARAAMNRYRAIWLPDQRDAACAQAADDLRAVAEVAERCGMLLFQTDYHLEVARWALTLPDQIHGAGWAKPMGELSAAEHLQQAEDLMQSTGYGWPKSAVRHLHECLAPAAH